MAGVGGRQECAGCRGRGGRRHRRRHEFAGWDPQTDLAVLKVKVSRELQVIALGSSASVKVGEPVVAVGAPLGLSGTVTSGIISALDRAVEVPGENDRSALLVSAIPTDAAINLGDSGGALVNCPGQLVGVPAAGATVPGSAGGSIGLGFAIPVDLAKSIADEIIATGRVTHAFFGLATAPIPHAAAAQARAPEGLFVQAVTPDGPAGPSGAGPRRRHYHHRRPARDQQHPAAGTDGDQESRRHGLDRLLQSRPAGHGDDHAGRATVSDRKSAGSFR
jgi:hypothetical protein